MLKIRDVIVVTLLAVGWRSPCAFAEEDMNNERVMPVNVVRYGDFGTYGGD